MPRLRYTPRFKFDVSRAGQARVAAGGPAAKLVGWVGVPGSRLGDDLFTSIGLPNGKRLRLFHASRRRNGRRPPDEEPNEKPETFAALRVSALPSRPEMPYPNERDVPRCLQSLEQSAPPPLKVMLDSMEPAPAFGVMRTDALTLQVAKRVVAARREHEAPAEAAAVSLVLEASAFAPRKRQSDGHSFWNTPKILARAFELDWSRTCTERFRQAVAKSDDDGLEQLDSEMDEIKEARNHLLHHPFHRLVTAS